MGADLVQEMAVMGDDDHGILEPFEKAFQPGDRTGVQVVGRLVQKQDVGITEESLGQKDPDLLTAAQFLHLFTPDLFRDAETGEQDCRLGLDVVAVQFGKLGLQFAASDAVRLGELRLGIDRVPLPHHLIETLMTDQHGVGGGFLFKGELVLAEHCNTLAGADKNIPFVRVEPAGQDLQESGLPGTVGADNAIAVAGGEFNIDVFEDNPLAIGKGDVRCLYHGC